MTLSELISTSAAPIFLDGAMGTQLAEAGLEMGGENNLTHPDSVRAVHTKYVEAGVNCITTNTLTLNRVNLESHQARFDVKKINEAGVLLARQAAGTKAFVLGDLGSSGKMLKPYGPLSEEEAYEAFREQASILAGGGVDGFIIETMFDLREAVTALRACKEAADLPVIVSIAFNILNNGGRTIMGNSSRDCARTLTDAGAAVIGANCGNLDPFQMAEIVSWMREVTALPIAAQPNAGRPLFVNNRTVFDMPPDRFADGAVQCVKAGALFVGGCCGTSPAHIRALVEKLRQP